MNSNKHIPQGLAISAALLCAGSTLPLQAEVTLPAFFSDNMIVQRNATMELFGKAKAGKTVSVTASWDGKRLETKADAEGNWSVTLTTPDAGGPYRITCSDGKKTVLDNVMSGEVWFCSGQSNMEMPVAGWGKIKNY